MPTYSFECLKCLHAFDEFTSIGKQTEVVCPECGGAVKRVYDGRCLVSVKSKGDCSGNCNACAGCKGA